MIFSNKSASLQSTVQLQHGRDAKRENRHLEHQFGAPPHRPGHPLSREQQPDVLCLQETKVIDDLFPAEAFAKLGYVHQAIHGQKAYHGVAVLSRLPFREDRRRRISAAKAMPGIWA